MPVDALDRADRAQEKLTRLRTQYNFAEFRVRMGDFGACQVQFRLHGQSWPQTWLDERDVNESHPDLLRLFKDEICTRRHWSAFPPDALVNETGKFRGLWSDVRKKHPSGVSAAPEGDIKLEDDVQADIKPSLTPPPGAPPPGSSFSVEDGMGTRRDTTGRPAPGEPTPEPPRVLYDPTLYPPTDPVVPKRGRARALDFEPIHGPPVKKRRVEPPPKSASTPAPPPPPQPKQTTLFTSNKSGPITRTRDGKFVPVPTLPKPPRWGLSPEERAELGLEPLIATELRHEQRSGDGGLSTSTSGSGVGLDANAARNQPDVSTSAKGVDKVTGQDIELEDYEDDGGGLLSDTDDSPQEPPVQSSSTSRWTRPSFLSAPRDREDLGSHVNGPFVSLFIPPWLLASLPSYQQTTAVLKGVLLILEVEPMSHSDEVGVHVHLGIWTKCFRRTSDIKLCDVDDFQRFSSRLMKQKSPFYQLSVIDDAPDQDRVVLQELGSYLEANSQLITLPPSESRPDDPSGNSTSGRDCGLFLFSPGSVIFPRDSGVQTRTLTHSGLVGYYEDADLFNHGIGDV